MGAIPVLKEETTEDLSDLLNSLDLPPDEVVLDDEVQATAEVAVEEPKKPKGKMTKIKEPKAPKAPKEPKAKKEPVPRVFYKNKVERLTAKLGDQLGDFTVLEVADALLTGDALKAKQQETLNIVKNSGVKVQNRQTFILEFISGKSAKLNSVIQTALAILVKEGYISIGVEGNLYKALLAKPYSVNASKAMGNNTLLALKSLKVVVEGEKAKYVANPNSLILAKLKAMGVTK